MKISARSRKFHDPWGNRAGNRQGQICRWQYMVGIAGLGDEIPSVNERKPFVDGLRNYEYNMDRFVLGKNSTEALRR